MSKRKRNKPLSRYERIKRRLKMQGFCCPYCGEKVKIKAHDPRMAPSLDHVVPKSKGGKGDFRVVAHLHCNQEKADRDPYACEVFYFVVIEEIEREQRGAFLAGIKAQKTRDKRRQHYGELRAKALNIL